MKIKKEYKITMNLNSIEKVKAFSAKANELTGLLKVSDGTFTVNGKSILGLFSLNLTNPVDITYIYDTIDGKDDVNLLIRIINTI